MRCPTCRSCRPQRVLDTESLDESNVRLRVCMDCGTSYRTREAVETIERPRAQAKAKVERGAGS